MAIYIRTSTPNKLLKEIKELIKDGKIDTWSVDDAGDFTHSVDQWRYRAWLRPRVEADRLVLGILCRKDRDITVIEYAMYHGRFIEMVLAHFDSMCSDVVATSMPTKYDTISNSK